MTKRAILYARKSTIDKAAWAGLESQLELCREYAGANDWHVVAQLAEDNVSGADWMTPEIERALDLAESGVFDVLVARQMDRLARDLGKQLFIERQFEKAGVEVAYVLERYDDTPEGVLQKLVKGAIAEYERLETARRTRRGLVAKLASGKVVTHGRAPYGYRENDGELIIDEAEAAVVRQVFDWYTGRGLGLSQIANRLTQEGIPRYSDIHGVDSPSSHWSFSTIYGMLRNRTYAGEFVHAAGPVVEVPAIVSLETFEAAQKQRVANRRASPRNLKHKYLLRRLVVCGRCGLKASSQPRTWEGRTYLYYKCPATVTGRRAHKCDLPHFRADQVDPVVWGWVRRFLTDDEYFGAIVAAGSQADDPGQYLEEELERTLGALGQRQRDRERILDLYLDQGWGREELYTRRDRLDREIDELESRQRSLEARMAADGREGELAALREARRELRELVGPAEKDFDLRRELVVALVERVVLMAAGKRKSVRVEVLPWLGETLVL